MEDRTRSRQCARPRTARSSAYARFDPQRGQDHQSSAPTSPIGSTGSETDDPKNLEALEATSAVNTPEILLPLAVKQASAKNLIASLLVVLRRELWSCLRVLYNASDSPSPVVLAILRNEAARFCKAKQI